MESIPNNRLFIVDNSLAQDKGWLRELFTAMIPLKKNWVSHPILDDDEILDLAAEAGCWYVYQAIFDTSDVIRNRIQRLKDHGIGVEGTIILGTDDQDEDGHQAAGRLPAGDRAGRRRVHDHDALPALADPRARWSARGAS